jgi:hypothetical protein
LNFLLKQHNLVSHANANLKYQEDHEIWSYVFFMLNLNNYFQNKNPKFFNKADDIEVRSKTDKLCL